MTRGIVSTPHRLASEAAGQVLRDGGNAVDAAVAANAVLCVVYPHMTTIGGDLFALVWGPGLSAPEVVEGAGPAGSGASVDAVRAAGHDRMPSRGPLTVTVPGAVQAWGRLLERFGKFGFQPVLEPAVALARDGFPVAANLAAALAAEAPWLMQEPEAARLFPPLKAGMSLRNPDLALTLAGIGRHGFNDFYRGEVAAAIAETVRAGGGFLTREDMATYRSTLTRPLALDWRGLTVYQAPPPTQGLALLGMLVRARAEAARWEPGPQVALEVKRLRDLVYPLRDRYLADPTFVEVPLRPFLDPAHEEAAPRQVGGEGGTVYLCAADELGHLVSLIQSVAYPFGSGVVAGGTGILLQNRGAYFSLDPTHANRLEPRKRTSHTLIPGLVTRGGRPWAALGSMGADGQPQLQLQVLLNLLRGDDPEAAVSQPRVRVAEGGGQLAVEADYPGALELQRSLDVRLLPPRSSYFGHAAAVTLGPRGWQAGADPRSDGSVVVV